MFKIGDIIVYGNTGVCEVTEITTINGIRGIDSTTPYYVLKPKFQNGTVYSPVDNQKVVMRKIISKSEANEIIDMIPQISCTTFGENSIQELSEHYSEMIKTHNCEDLIRLTMSIYAKKQKAEKSKHKLWQIDEKYMKRAEELLFEELSVALGIEKDSVPQYIKSRIE